MRLWKWFLLIGAYLVVVAVVLKKRQEDDDRITEIERAVDSQADDLHGLIIQVDNIADVVRKEKPV